jgi:tetratricopeptide (TPR) repeat protein
MSVKFLSKLVVLMIAAIALIYGVFIVIGKNGASWDGTVEPSAAQVDKPVAVADISVTAPQTTAMMPLVDPVKEDADAVQKRVKKSVQFLEEGNSAQALVEMRAAIDAAKSQIASPVEMDVLCNMLMLIQYCENGPDGMLTWLASPEAALAIADPLATGSLERSRMKIEALLSMGKLQESWDESKVLLARFSQPGATSVKEPLALEQAIRIAGTAGANDQIPDLEMRLRAAVEAGITLKTLQDPQLPLATLGTLAKARGDCASAIKLYDQALEGFDINQWLREKRVAPWRMQVLALVAMDRVDCLRQIGQSERAKGRASVLAADLATALGEDDPISRQAADQRDQMLYAPMSP